MRIWVNRGDETKNLKPIIILFLLYNFWYLINHKSYYNIFFVYTEIIQLGQQFYETNQFVHYVTITHLIENYVHKYFPYTHTDTIIIGIIVLWFPVLYYTKSSFGGVAIILILFDLYRAHARGKDER